MALPKAKQDATEAFLAQVTLPEGAAWASAARKAALERLREMGVPVRRDEYWRFTRPETLFERPAPEAAVFVAEEEPVFGAIDRLKLVFVDGVFDAAASDDPTMEGVEITRLSQAAAADIHWARDLYGVLEARGQADVPRPLAALNSATATDGVVIRVTGKPSRPISLIYLHRDRTSDVVMHHLVRVEPGAELTLLENGPAAARFNKCMEVEVAKGGTFHHVRAQGRDHERRCVSHMFGRLADEATYKSFTLTANGVLTRNEQVL